MIEQACDICIVGGGPAAMMAALLFARAGLSVTIVEKHGDFLRDFRGDTIHPSTLDLFDELGLFDTLLALPHDKVRAVGATIAGRAYRVADFTHLPGRGRFIAMMPQWHFLDFVAGQAKAYSGFRLLMQTEACDLLEEDGRVAGVVTGSGKRIGARLVIAADGRGSRVRELAGLPLEDLGAPIDVFWFRMPAPPAAENRTHAYVGPGEMVVVIDRRDYFQCARVIRKGSADAVRARGLACFRQDVAAAAPPLRDLIDAVASWDEIKLLSVSLDRLTRWHRPGLLAIGDAAHAMSPVGGVGINLAIQDAVAAANILAAPMRAGTNADGLLQRVQDRRSMPVRMIQRLQRAAHRRVLGAALDGRQVSAPALLKVLDRVPALQRLPARVIGLGIRREHIRSPNARLT